MASPERHLPVYCSRLSGESVHHFILDTSCIKGSWTIKPLVIRAGFEPTTRSLEGCCSIQLSYRTRLVSYSEVIVIGLTTCFHTRKGDYTNLSYRQPTSFHWRSTRCMISKLLNHSWLFVPTLGIPLQFSECIFQSTL